MFSKQYKLLLMASFLYLNSVHFKVAIANTIFRFGFNFGLNVNENSFKTSLQLDNVDETTTMSPILMDIWSKQAQLNSAANSKIQATQISVSQLYNEISTVVGCSGYIAAKVKLMSRYLHHLNASTSNVTTADNDAGNSDSENSAAAKHFSILQDYVKLIDALRVPPTNEEGGERSSDYMVMKLGLEKYKLIELQTEILKDVLEAMEAWQTYTKKQIVEVITV
ncbi:hypothetical protein DOY81_001859 [Sarcophaga bullata]|nr:hypothetical protein DOY81_001859 [Sarcophaga bullata]